MRRKNAKPLLEKGVVVDPIVGWSISTTWLAESSNSTTRESETSTQW